MNDAPTTRAYKRPLHNGSIVLMEYDPRWPEAFAREAEEIVRALGSRARRIEHVGSTSVPGLAAKQCIDILLEVGDSSSEADYRAPLETADFVLRVREPDWHQHRMFGRVDGSVHLHVFSEGCSEIDRMVLFRDHLRSHRDDRELYERTKRELGQRKWRYMQDYADAKGPVVEEILARARDMSEGSRGGESNS